MKPSSFLALGLGAIMRQPGYLSDQSGTPGKKLFLNPFKVRLAKGLPDLPGGRHTTSLQLLTTELRPDCTVECHQSGVDLVAAICVQWRI